MRWKILATLIVLGLLGAAGGVGYYKWREVSRAREAARRFEMALNQMNLGQHETAQRTLEGLLEKFEPLADRDAVLATLARAYAATDNTARAQVCWQRIIDEHPGSPHVAEALSYVGERLYEAGDTEGAVGHWKLILERFPESEGADDAAFGLGRLAYKRDGAQAGRQALLEHLERYPESNRRSEAEELLGQINMEMLYSFDRQAGDQIYKVQSGDTLDGIGKRFNVSPDLLARINRIPPERVRSLSVGKRLKIPKVDFSIEVDKTENTLLLLNNGEFFKRYPCRTGKDDWRTPNGTFHIQRKVKNPTWNDPVSGRTLPPNHPENELGTRWLAFEGSLGIHGTIDPKTIGNYASNGCVGLLKEDVEELYDLVPLGTEVQIKGKMKRSGR